MNFRHFFQKENLKQLYGNANHKRIVGFIILIIGIILFIYSIYAAKQVADANNLSTSMTNFFEHNTAWNPLIEFFGGEAQKEIDYYGTMTLMIQIGGIALTALGAVMVVVYRKKKNKP